MSDEKAPRRRRVQLDFSERGFARLKDLRARADSSTNAELIRVALRLLEWHFDQQKKGTRVQVVDGDQVREVEFLHGDKDG